MSVSKVMKLDEIGRNFPIDFDAFFTCISFDPRSALVAERLIQSSFQGPLIVFSEAELTDGADAHYKNIKSKYGRMIVNITGYGDSPLEFADSFLVRSADIIQNSRNIGVDITSFTSETLLIFLKILQMYLQNGAKVTLFYMTANEYAPLRPESPQWLTKGVTEIRTVLGYAGSGRASHRTHLILMVGIELEAAYATLVLFEPSKISIGYSAENQSVNLTMAKANADVAMQICNNSLYKTNVFQFSAIDPVYTAQNLDQQIDSDFRNIFIPLNNKISTVGLFILSQARPEIQIGYVRPKAFNEEEYCTGGDSFITFQFEKIAEILAPINSDDFNLSQ